MRRRQNILIGGALLAVASFGCTSQESTTSPTQNEEPSTTTTSETATQTEGGSDDRSITAKEVREEVGEASQAIEAYSEQKTEAALQNARTSLDNIKQQLAQLKGDVDDLQESAQTDFQETLANLESNLKSAEERLAGLQKTGSEAWEQAQRDLQEAMNDLEQTYQEAVAAFQERTTDSEASSPETNNGSSGDSSDG